MKIMQKEIFFSNRYLVTVKGQYFKKLWIYAGLQCSNYKFKTFYYLIKKIAFCLYGKRL